MREEVDDSLFDRRQKEHIAIHITDQSGFDSLHQGLFQWQTETVGADRKFEWSSFESSGCDKTGIAHHFRGKRQSRGALCQQKNLEIFFRVQRMGKNQNVMTSPQKF